MEQWKVIVAVCAIVLKCMIRRVVISDRWNRVGRRISVIALCIVWLFFSLCNFPAKRSVYTEGKWTKRWIRRIKIQKGAQGGEKGELFGSDEGLTFLFSPACHKLCGAGVKHRT